MTDTDRPRFASMLSAVLDLYGKAPGEGAIGIWWAALVKFDFEAAQRAFSLYIQDPDQGRFPPTPAGIIGQIEATGSQAATAAFDKVVSAIRHVGPYESVAFDDPIIHAVVEGLGGWIHICNSWTNEDLKFREREFVTRYQVDRKATCLTYQGTLTGIAEAQNSLGGLRTSDGVCMIGDASKAQAVRDGGGKGRLQIARSWAGGLRQVTAQQPADAEQA